MCYFVCIYVMLCYVMFMLCLWFVIEIRFKSGFLFLKEKGKGKGKAVGFWVVLG